MLKINNLGIHLDNDLLVYHASLAADAIKREGAFRSRFELRQQGLVKTGAGGGPEKAISFTGDVRVAESICVGLGAIVRISLDDLKTQEIIHELHLSAPKALNSLWGDLKHIRQLDPKDNLELYKLFLDVGYNTRELFDPLFFGTNVNMFRQSSLSVLDSIGIVSARLKAGTIIFPRDSESFRSILSSKRDIFNIDEFTFEHGVTPVYSDPLIKYEDLKSNNIEIIENENPTLETLKTKGFVSYLPALNEFRVWDSRSIDKDSIFKEDSWSDICLYSLPEIWRKSGIYSFYPYFNYDDLASNITQS